MKWAKEWEGVGGMKFNHFFWWVYPWVIAPKKINQNLLIRNRKQIVTRNY